MVVILRFLVSEVPLYAKRVDETNGEGSTVYKGTSLIRKRPSP